MRRTLRSLCLSTLVVWSMLAVAGWAVPVSTAAQGVPDAEMQNLGYLSPDGATLLTLIHLDPDDPSLAGEMVSPQYADDFFQGFTIFTDYDFASDLDPDSIDQVDGADEYMVFAGDLDSYDGVKPGYVILLSASQQVFLLVAYQTDADDLFDLAALTIDEGAAPGEFGDFERVNLDDLEPSNEI